jgi:hypothetical protein
MWKSRIGGRIGHPKHAKARRGHAGVPRTRAAKGPHQFLERESSIGDREVVIARVAADGQIIECVECVCRIVIKKCYNKNTIFHTLYLTSYDASMENQAS